jgi:gamma-glutamylcyclotransferase
MLPRPSRNPEASSPAAKTWAREERKNGRCYFAYGLNLSSEQMLARCPGSARVVRGNGLARLNGWEWGVGIRGYANVWQVDEEEREGRGSLADGTADGKVEGEGSGGEGDDGDGDEDSQEEQSGEEDKEGNKLIERAMNWPDEMAGLVRELDRKWNVEGCDEYVDGDGNGDGGDVVLGVLYTLTPADEARLDRCEGVPWAYDKFEMEVEIECEADEETSKGGDRGRGSARERGTERKREKIVALVYIDLRPERGRCNKAYAIRLGSGFDEVEELVRGL